MTSYVGTACPRSLCISFNEGNIPKVIDMLVRFIWICLANQVHQFLSWLWQQSCGLKKDPRLRPRQWCEWVLFTVNDEKQKRGWREHNLEIHKIEKTRNQTWNHSIRGKRQTEDVGQRDTEIPRRTDDEQRKTHTINTHQMQWSDWWALFIRIRKIWEIEIGFKK